MFTVIRYGNQTCALTKRNFTSIRDKLEDFFEHKDDICLLCEGELSVVRFSDEENLKHLRIGKQTCLHCKEEWCASCFLLDAGKFLKSVCPWCDKTHYGGIGATEI